MRQRGARCPVWIDMTRHLHNDALITRSKAHATYGAGLGAFVVAFLHSLTASLLMAIVPTAITTHPGW
jgi:hypothetical protein